MYSIIRICGSNADRGPTWMTGLSYRSDSRRCRIPSTCTGLEARQSPADEDIRDVARNRADSRQLGCGVGGVPQL